VGFFNIPTKDEAIRNFLKSETDEELKLKNRRVNFLGFLIFSSILLAGLLNRLGIFPLTIFATFWRFWPIFFFMALLQLFLKKLKFVSIVVLGLGLGLIASIVIYSTAAINSTTSNSLRAFYSSMSGIMKYLPIDPGAKLTKTVNIEKTTETIENRQIDITLDTGKINIKDSSAHEEYKINSTYYEKIGAPQVIERVENNKQIIATTSQFDLGAMLGGVEDLSYDIEIGDTQIPTDLNIFVGATIFNSMLTNIIIDNFIFDLGTGTANLTIGDVSYPKGEFKINVNAGLLTLKIPFRSYVRINYNIGAGRLRVNDKVLRGNGSFLTTNFRVTDSPKDIFITINAGDVLIDTKGGE
jgi:hypothetical protein